MITGRQCGGCTLCCKLLPVHEGFSVEARAVRDELTRAGILTDFPTFKKPAFTPCPHQRHGKGCSVYERRPYGCRAWTCAWLAGEETLTHRPDRAGFCVDAVPDYITLVDNDTGVQTHFAVMQVWMERDEKNDPDLRALIEKMGREHHMATLLRYRHDSAITVIPPSLAADGKWHEITNEMMIRDTDRDPEQHTAVMKELMT